MKKGIGRSAAKNGFTLAEVVIALGIACLGFSGIIRGYSLTTNRAEWSSYSLAAHSLAQQGIEQARAAKWDPRAWPPVDELGATNYVQLEQLDVPVAVGNAVWATNYVSITDVSADPPVRELRSVCVWNLTTHNGSAGGPYTNIIVALRTADQ